MKSTQEKIIKQQKCLYNSAILENPNTAYGTGLYQDIYYQHRIALALNHSTAGAYVLDFGAGNGTIAKALALKNRRIDAIDISDKSIEFAKNNNNHSNINYYVSSIESFEVKKKYDLILMYEVIEHVFNPYELLNKAKSLLKDSGRIILSSPNRDRLDTYIRKFFSFIKNKKFTYKICSDHVEEYTYSELKHFIKKSGFSLIANEPLFLSLKITRKLFKNDCLVKLLSKTGKIIPQLSHHLYFVIEKNN